MKKMMFAVLFFFCLQADIFPEVSGAFDKASDDMRFDNAYQFYRLEQFDKAAVLFMEYLEVYEDGSHREAAFSYLAGIYFSRQDFRKALKTYLSHFSEYSDTEDGVRAYYNAGICYRKMGMKSESEQVFRIITEEYSAYQTASDARIQLDVQNITK